MCFTRKYPADGFTSWTFQNKEHTSRSAPFNSRNSKSPPESFCLQPRFDLDLLVPVKCRFLWMWEFNQVCLRLCVCARVCVRVWGLFRTTCGSGRSKISAGVRFVSSWQPFLFAWTFEGSRPQNRLPVVSRKPDVDLLAADLLIKDAAGLMAAASGFCLHMFVCFCGTRCLGDLWSERGVFRIVCTLAGVSAAHETWVWDWCQTWCCRLFDHNGCYRCTQTFSCFFMGGKTRINNQRVGFQAF